MFMHPGRSSLIKQFDVLVQEKKLHILALPSLHFWFSVSSRFTSCSLESKGNMPQSLRPSWAILGHLGHLGPLANSADGRLRIFAWTPTSVPVLWYEILHHKWPPKLQESPRRCRWSRSRLQQWMHDWPCIHRRQCWPPQLRHSWVPVRSVMVKSEIEVKIRKVPQREKPPLQASVSFPHLRGISSTAPQVHVPNSVPLPGPRLFWSYDWDPSSPLWQQQSLLGPSEFPRPISPRPEQNHRQMQPLCQCSARREQLYPLWEACWGLLQAEPPQEPLCKHHQPAKWQSAAQHFHIAVCRLWHRMQPGLLVCRAALRVLFLLSHILLQKTLAEQGMNEITGCHGISRVMPGG